MKLPVVKEQFLNSKGKLFKLVREIRFEHNLMQIGELVNESVNKVDEEDGVYIYRDYSNKNKAYRIYKQFAQYGFDGNKDEHLIEELQKRNIPSLHFPTGVVTLDGKVKGQEIEYFNNSVSLDKYFSSNPGISKIIECYKQVLLKLRLMVEKGIYYQDIKSENFIVDVNTGEVNVIDFDKYFIAFDTEDELPIIFEKVTNMINGLNKTVGISMIDKYDSFCEYDDILEKIKKIS